MSAAAMASHAEAADAPVLRVLAGSNAGAELPLGLGDWLIGSGPDADLTFAEPALEAAHLRLLVHPSGVRVVALAEGLAIAGRAVPVDVEATLPLLVPLRIGVTLFALGTPDADWTRVAPEAEPAAEVAPEEAPEPASAAAAEDPAAAIGTDTQAETPPEAAAPKLVAPPRTRRLAAGPGRIGAVAVALLVLVLAAAGGAWHVWFQDPPVAPAPRAEPLQTLHQIIRSLGMQEVVSAAARGRGTFAVTGQLRTEEQLRALTTEIRRTGLQVDIAVATETGMAEQAATILRAFGVDGSVAITGAGTLTVRGFAPSAAAASSVVARLRNEVPGVQNVQSALVTPERAREVLEARLQGAGLAHVLRISGSQQRLTVTGLLSPEQMTAWNDIAARFRTDYASHVTLNAEIAAPGQVTPRGVMLGRAPYLVLDGGQRVHVGETIENVGRVTSIDARRVRVETPAGPADIPFAHAPNWILEEKNDAPR